MPFYQREWNDQEGVESWRAALNQRVEHLNNFTAAEPLKGENNFLNYIIHKDQVLFAGIYSTIYACTNPQEPTDSTLMCRMFQPNSKIGPEEDIYLKILRFTDRQCPNIIGTMDIFYDDTRHIYLFQEFANRGNCLEYLRAGNFVEMKQMARWANSIWLALDFLGSNAIVHRNIRPKHILLKSGPNGELMAKLSGFRDAMIYWDPKKKDIIDVPKRDSSCIRFASFQAPETCKIAGGQNSETYNPIVADVWSFGATFFYVVTRTYPFDLANSNDLTKIDAEVKKRVRSVVSMNDDIKNWFDSLLEIDLEKRINFANIMTNPWLQSVIGVSN